MVAKWGEGATAVPVPFRVTGLLKTAVKSPIQTVLLLRVACGVRSWVVRAELPLAVAV